MKTKEEAIRELGCEEKQCKHLNKEGVYSFCKVIFTEDSCLLNRDIDE